MATKTASNPQPAKTTQKKPIVPLPPSVMGLLNRKQVCAALGLISERKLDEMIASREFPRSDKRVGRSPRWSVALVNQWVHDLEIDPRHEPISRN